MAKRPIYVNWMTSIDRQARQAEKAIQEKAKYDQETERRMGLKKEKAGVVVYRTENQNEPTVLVVSARKYENQWVFPVGSVEKDETLEAAAMRECREESGYRVELGKRLPALQIEGNHQMKRFTFFLATVIGEVGQWGNG